MQMTLLLTRPEPQASMFAQDCAKRFPEIDQLLAPVMRIEPVGEPVTPEGGLILTSPNAVQQIGELPPNAQVPAYCVGVRTSEAARDLGLNIALMAQDAEALIAGILQEPPLVPLLHMRGEHSHGDICGRINNCTEQVVYRQLGQDLSAEAKQLLQGDAPVIVPLFSARSAQLLAAQLDQLNAPLLVAAFSPAVREAWTGPSEHLETADRPNSRAMMAAIERLLA